MLHVSSSFRNFLQRSESRVATFLDNALRYENWGYSAVRYMITDKEVNYLTLRSDGKLSFLPKGKTHVLTDSGSWARENRQEGAPSKIIRKVFTKKALKLFKDVDFEAFCNQYKSACDAEQKTFVIRPNHDIPDVYSMGREYGGTLGDSCMNDDTDYLEMYENIKGLRILTLINVEGRLSGRALLWTLPNGDVFCDRIYVAQDHYYDMFIDYCNEQGWWRKHKYKTYADKNVWWKGSEMHEGCYYKIPCNTEYSYYPYIDTFTYGGDGWLSNNWDESGRQYEYTDTGGGREGDNRTECAVSGDFIDDDDAVYIERGSYADRYIHIDHSVYCETDNLRYYENDSCLVEVDDHWYRTDDDDLVWINDTAYHCNDEDICYSEHDGENYLKSDCEYSDYHEDYFLSDDVVYSEHHESYIREDESYEVVGAYFHESVVNKVA